MCRTGSDPSTTGCSRGPLADAPAKPAAETPPAPIATIRNARRLTAGTDVEHGPTWSPDGQFVAYVTWNDDDGGRIYRARADGTGQPEWLTPVAAFYDKLTYSRDGSRLIGVRGSKMHRLRTLQDFGDLGSLEAGKLADLIVLDANPLDDLKNTARIAEVMKNGRLYDAATLNETNPRRKALEPQWWWKLEPPARSKARSASSGMRSRFTERRSA